MDDMFFENGAMREITTVKCHDNASGDIITQKGSIESYVHPKFLDTIEKE